jgi:hypothetical protein
MSGPAAYVTACPAVGLCEIEMEFVASLHRNSNCSRALRGHPVIRQTLKSGHRSRRWQAIDRTPERKQKLRGWQDINRTSNQTLDLGRWQAIGHSTGGRIYAAGRKSIG